MFLGLYWSCGSLFCDPAKHNLVGGIDESGQAGLRPGEDHVTLSIDAPGQICPSILSADAFQESPAPRDIAEITARSTASSGRCKTEPPQGQK